MKRNAFLVLGLLVLTVPTVFAQPKAKKILNKEVPADQSAIIYVPKGAVLYKCDDTTFGIVTDVLASMNLKGSGGDALDGIAKPILQIPAGKHTITANIDENNYGKGRMVTHTFLPGHYYQMVFLLNLPNAADAVKEVAKLSVASRLIGIDWCFLDITEDVKAKKKKSTFFEVSKRGEIGKGQTVEKVPTITNPGAK